MAAQIMVLTKRFSYHRLHDAETQGIVLFGGEVQCFVDESEGSIRYCRSGGFRPWGCLRGGIGSCIGMRIIAVGYGGGEQLVGSGAWQ